MTQAADEFWQRTVDGHNGPVVTNPTVSEFEHPTLPPEGDDSDGMDFSSPTRLSDRTRNSRPKNTLLQRCVAANDENPRRVPHVRPRQMALPLGRMCGKCPDAARQHHSPTCRKDLATGRGQALVSAENAVLSWTYNLTTDRPKPLVGTAHAFTPSWAD